MKRDSVPQEDRSYDFARFLLLAAARALSKKGIIGRGDFISEILFTMDFILKVHEEGKKKGKESIPVTPTDIVYEIPPQKVVENFMRRSKK